MHGHRSAREERVRSDVFWSKSKSVCSNTNGLGPEDRDDVQGADRADPMAGVRVVADRGGSQAPMFTHVKEYVDTRSNQVGWYQLISEVRDGFPLDFIHLVVQGKDDLGGVLEMFNWGVRWEESIPNKEDEVQEGLELSSLAATSALGVFTRTEAEVEDQLYQVRDMTGFGVGGDGRCGHNGVDNAEGGGLFLFDQRVLDAVGFNLKGDASVQSGVSLGVWRISGVG